MDRRLPVATTEDCASSLLFELKVGLDRVDVRQGL
jgi:hypothetical protein